ncbi:hypothetical protein CCAX7_65040 [Capsulimonas corticalis]|uniref:GH18 domain-containing protein n=1 Tax=Capsulimonas corticalis TaxID=2219043 RepID=A0A402CR39_9BACT|nr:glycosyl hydrolase family 18 protein [Capsulimonas corticalis]BDI34453.1 hypothetical protein CCAX7_65040 [Capsulimonas corticalis]
MKSKLTKHRQRIGLAILAFVILILADIFLYPMLAQPPGPMPTATENGLWLRYTWYFGGARDYDGLAQRLQEEKIRDAYFHVRGIDADGHLHFRYPDRARRLTSEVHKRSPGVRAIAWIYAGNSHGEGKVDLSRPEVRAAMAQEARWLAEDCGFDGVQWDYEICANGDPHLLELLEETRAAMPAGKLLSVATPLWSPIASERLGWDDAYFQKVAARCDQMTVMAYDSGLYSPRIYVWLVAQQVTHVTQDAAAANPSCRVLIGVPTYAKGGLSHDPHTENMRMGLIGVRTGLADPQTKQSAFAGVAPFADYTTQADEWRTYDEIWRRRD